MMIDYLLTDHLPPLLPILPVFLAGGSRASKPARGLSSLQFDSRLVGAGLVSRVFVAVLERFGSLLALARAGVTLPPFLVESD